MDDPERKSPAQVAAEVYATHAKLQLPGQRCRCAYCETHRQNVMDAERAKAARGGA